jgi:hypothetical protein
MHVDRKDGQVTMERNTRLGHLARGNTVANPAYRRKFVENLKGGNWGSASGGSAKKEN